MIKSRDRDKLINAAVFFGSNTRYCGKIKLIKLLYLLDFEVFRQTGSSVTGLDYRAWKMGPVPVALYEEWDCLEPDFAAATQIVPEKVHDHFRERVVPRRDFDDSHFTQRELRVMTELAVKFHDEFSRPLVNFTHAELGPWFKIWDSGRGYQERIPYTLAVSDDDPFAEAVLEAASDRQSIRDAVGIAH
ncbi:MAG: Panacea domain-containing protein [Dokdonella sp.]